MHGRERVFAKESPRCTNLTENSVGLRAKALHIILHSAMSLTV